MMKRRLHSQPRGMTLVEILFAFAIIGTVITVAYSAALKGWRSAAAANQRTEAQYVAQSALEEVKAYRDLSNSGTPQKRMTWSAAVNNGTGGFLQEMQAKQGPDPDRTGGFTVRSCPPDRIDCEWLVLGGARAYTAPGDSTRFDVIIRTSQLTCAGGTVSTLSDLCSNNPLNVESVTMQARVTWTDANGIGSEAIASTIISEPD